MYELTVMREFCAAHALTIKGVREPVHGHNWRVTVTVHGEQLDDDGMLCDFHELEQRLDAVIGHWNNRDLNGIAPFDTVNPTAEHVAREIGQAMGHHLPAGVRVKSVAVTEAPGCCAVWVGR